MKALIMISLLSWLWTGVEATEPVVIDVPQPDPVLETWRWQFFTEIDGLPSVRVHDIHQGAHAIWFATDRGVARYDGLEWAAYSADGDLPDDDVRAVSQEAEGAVWFATAAGVVRYDGRSWATFGKRQGLPSDEVTDVLVSAEGEVWVGTVAGLARLESPGWELFGLANGLADTCVNQIEQTADGAIWVATERGVSRFDGQTWHSFRRGTGIPGTSVTSATATRDGGIWFAMYGTGLTRYLDGAWETFTPSNGLPDAQVRQVIQARDGSIWALCRSGLALYTPEDPARWRLYDRSVIRGLGQPYVAGVDDRGAIWIGGQGSRGIARFDYEGERCRVFDLSTGFPRSGAGGIGHDVDGGVWLGVDPGAARYDGLQWVHQAIFDGPVTSAITVADQKVYLLGKDAGTGTVWEVQGLSRCRLDWVTPAPAPAPSPSALSLTSQGLLWLGTLDGQLFLRDEASQSWGEVLSDYLPSRIASLESTSDGTLWILGDSGQITLRLRNGVFRPMRIETVSYIHCAYVDRDDKLWLGQGRGGGGVTWLDTRSMDSGSFTVIDGLPHDEVYALDGRDGRVWAGTSAGLAAYHIEDGAWAIPANVPEVHVKDLHLDRDGAVWVRSARGQAIRYLNDGVGPVTRMDMPPSLVPPDGTVTFVWEGYDVWASSRAEMTYSHRLDTGDWSPFTARNRVTLVGLADGDHQIEIRSRDGDLNVESAAFAHRFTVETPLWKSPWILLTAVCLLGTIAWQGRRILVRDHMLAEANERMQRVDQMKTDFFSNVSHELRTPMTAIKGYVDNMLDGIAGDVNERQTRYLNRVSSNADRLTGLINDLLDLSRIDRGRKDLLQLTLAEAEVRDVVLEAVDEIRPLAEQKNLELTFEGADGRANVDANRLKQMVINLVGNAIKFTDEGTVSVRVKRDGTGYIETIIKDTGKGMTPQDARNVFDRFYQVQSAQGATKGTGLGLPITKELTELQGGKIWAESKLGEGSVFTFTLPEVIRVKVGADA